MGLKDLNLKFKALRLRWFFTGEEGNSKKKRVGGETRKKPSWMTPITHGYQVLDRDDLLGRAGSREGSGFWEPDSVVVQREQIEGTELWFFGVFDGHVGDGVTKYLQSHLFNRKLNESQIRRKSKETIKKAYLGARAKAREMEAKKGEETWTVGSASVMVINGEKLVIANMGDYRAIVCRDGVAHQIGNGHHQSPKRHWSRRLFSVRVLACDSINTKQSKGSELAVRTEKIDSATEFVVIASAGIWDVLKNQEAVNLIRHLEDAQEAADCLAKEALTRMSKSNISCVVIRFD